jgi:SAM-dependent methyltransferase
MSRTDSAVSASADERALRLCTPASRRGAKVAPAGYIDLLGDADPIGDHPGQQLMASRALPYVYERLWRPFLGRALMGLTGPSVRDEFVMAEQMLHLLGGERVLDVACGTGAFTRHFGEAVGAEGLAVGLDASETMLARAATGERPPSVSFIRGDATKLPFRKGSFDAVCCFAALYLIEEPMKTLDECVRVLAPGGRIALLASVHRGPLPLEPTAEMVRTISGVRIFGRDELKRALRQRGVLRVRQRVSGFAQFVAGRAPDG